MALLGGRKKLRLSLAEQLASRPLRLVEGQLTPDDRGGANRREGAGNDGQVDALVPQRKLQMPQGRVRKGNAGGKQDAIRRIYPAVHRRIDKGRPGRWRHAKTQRLDERCVTHLGHGASPILEKNSAQSKYCQVFGCLGRFIEMLSLVHPGARLGG